MEVTDSLWRPLKGKAERKRRRRRNIKWRFIQILLPSCPLTLWAPDLCLVHPFSNPSTKQCVGAICYLCSSIINFITSAKEVVFSPMCMFACQQDYSKSNELICTDIYGGIGHGPGKKPFNLWAVLDCLPWIWNFFSEVWWLSFDTGFGWGLCSLSALQVGLFVGFTAPATIYQSLSSTWQDEAFFALLEICTLLSVILV